MNCALCKGDLKMGEVNHIVDLGHGIIIIKNVSAKVCSQCGEYYVDTKTAIRLEDIVDDFKRNMAEVLIIKYDGEVA